MTMINTAAVIKNEPIEDSDGTDEEHGLEVEAKRSRCQDENDIIKKEISLDGAVLEGDDYSKNAADIVKTELYFDGVTMEDDESTEEEGDEYQKTNEFDPLENSAKLENRNLSQEGMSMYLKNKVQCDICRLWYKDKESLFYHKFRHNTKGEFACNLCSKTAPNRKALRDHRYEAHEIRHEFNRNEFVSRPHKKIMDNMMHYASACGDYEYAERRRNATRLHPLFFEKHGTALILSKEWTVITKYCLKNSNGFLKVTKKLRDKTHTTTTNTKINKQYPIKYFIKRCTAPLRETSAEISKRNRKKKIKAAPFRYHIPKQAFKFVAALNWEFSIMNHKGANKIYKLRNDRQFVTLMFRTAALILVLFVVDLASYKL